MGKKKKTTLIEKKLKQKKKEEKKFDTGLFKFKGDDGKQYSINLRQKLFVEYYLEFKGNGVDAVIEAGYNCNYPRSGTPNRRLAASLASENLTKPNIIAYINIKLDEYGFNDDNVRKQHLFLLNQDADLTAKKGAIDMFYKVRGEYAAEKVDVRHLLDEFDDISTDDLKKTASLKSKK